MGESMMKTYANHYDFPASEWDWPDFSPLEMRSKGDGSVAIDRDAMDKLQQLRNIIDKPMRITSAYRSPAHNKAVGGAKSSMHLQARAFDVQMSNHNPAEFEAMARKVGFTGFGFYKKQGFMHIDTGAPREWGARWWDEQQYLHEVIEAHDAKEPEPKQSRWRRLIRGLFE